MYTISTSSWQRTSVGPAKTAQYIRGLLSQVQLAQSGGGECWSQCDGAAQTAPHCPLDLPGWNTIRHHTIPYCNILYQTILYQTKLDHTKPNLTIPNQNIPKHTTLFLDLAAWNAVQYTWLLNQAAQKKCACNLCTASSVVQC